MPRRRSDDDGDLIEGLAVFIALFLIGLVSFLVTKIRALSTTGRWLLGGGFVLFVFIALLLYIKYLRHKQRKLELLITEIRDKKMDVMINNFIERFGKEIRAKKASAWRYRDYAIDWKHLEDFRDELKSAGIRLPDKDFSEDECLDDRMEYILVSFIDEKEKKYVRERVQASASHSFDELNKKGDDFEHLIVRLSEARGYTSKRIAGVGDQGGDVIAAKGPEQVLIQAKCYTNPVGNDAVQEAVAARQHYGCTKAVVMTTSTFTPEAVALAHSNAVELVNRNQLQQYLAQYLHESWQ